MGVPGLKEAEPDIRRVCFFRIFGLCEQQAAQDGMVDWESLKIKFFPLAEIEKNRYIYK